MAGAEGTQPGGHSTADMLGTLKARLAEQAQDNPGLAMLLQLMEQRSAEAPASEDEVIELQGDEAAADASGLSPAMRADLQTLVAGSARLSAEVDSLRQRNDMLAAALGACHLCFGDDAWCPHCQGRGTPGARRPEPGAFGRYVQPLMQRLRGLQPGTPARPASAFGRAPPTSPGSAEGLQAGAS